MLLSLTLIVPLLVAIAFFTLAERKVMAAIQRRKGPNVVGFWGLLQPLADGLKLLLKEIIIPSGVNRYLFLFAPALTFILSLLNWALIPFDYDLYIIDLNYSLLYVYAISSFGVYGIILAGWSSKSRYPFLGALRSAAQMISYEVSIGLIFIIIALCANSLNLVDIVYHQHVTTWLVIPLFPICLVFFISILAETNRAPFDLPEAEAELVAGYNLEYSAITFALFFLGEYSNIILMSTLMSVLFFGGWLSPFMILNTVSWYGFWFALKTVIICFLFILVRAAYPRYRYDQLMDIGWKVFFPYNLTYLIMLMLVFFYFTATNVELDYYTTSNFLYNSLVSGDMARGLEYTNTNSPYMTQPDYKFTIAEQQY